MFSLVEINLFSLSLESAKKIDVAGMVGTRDPDVSGPAKHLSVPWWPEDPDRKDIFDLLNWRAKLTQFRGRETELNVLREWCESSKQISIKFVIGEGGVGKTRLAAEFAELMQAAGWEAGFVTLHEPGAFPMCPEGNLLVIDYPEENRAKVKELFRDLALLTKTPKLRVLFLTRRSIDEWQQIMYDSHASGLATEPALDLGGLDVDEAHDVCHEALEKVAEVVLDEDQTFGGIALDQFAEWHSKRQENARPLYLAAAGVLRALNPEDEFVRYTGAEVVDKLVQREMSRLRLAATNAGFDDEDSLARLLAMAAIADPLHVTHVEKLVVETKLPLGFASVTEVEPKLRAAGVLIGRAIEAPKPDILAAALTVTALATKGESAPEMIWAALECDLRRGLDRFGRLSYDAEIVLGMHKHRLSRWLAEAVQDDIDRGEWIAELASIERLEPGLLEAAVAALNCILRFEDDSIRKAGVLVNLSAHAAEFGDLDLALSAGEKAVSMWREIQHRGDSESRLALAQSLNNHSNNLSRSGAKADAVEALEESIAILRTFDFDDDELIADYLARGLANLAVLRDYLGNLELALAAVNESLRVYRLLAERNRERFAASLAMTLNNQANRLHIAQRGKEAWEAIEEALEIGTILSRQNPALFSSSYAMILNTHSLIAGERGDINTAHCSILLALEIWKRLARANPARHLPVFARCLSNVAGTARDIGDLELALAYATEAVDILRHLWTADPAIHARDLARTLGRCANVQRRANLLQQATQSLSEAADVIRPLAGVTGSPDEQLLEHIKHDIERTEALLKKTPGDS